MTKLERITEKLKKYGQEQLVKYAAELSGEDRDALLEQIDKIDLEKVMKLYREADGGETEEETCEFRPISYVERAKMDPDTRKKNRELGEKMIAAGQFAAVTMAGGQGTRLGHNGPKGTYDIGLESHASLFQIQCERLLATGKRLGKMIPWYIMTSRENDGATRAFFEEHGYFGYPKEDITFFVQNMLPMVSFDGKIVLDAKNHVKEGADGHGGVFAALKTGGCYEDMVRRGVKWIFVGGIDNVLLQLCDPEFIGFAENSGALVGAKSLVKRDAKEGVGVFCRKNGKPYVVEYTEISPEMAGLRNGKGEFVFGDAHVLCNIFSIEAFRKMIGEADGLPYHVARKKTSFVDGEGSVITPEKPNAFKFEAFIFDAFSEFDDIAILRVDRETEFAPVKNKEGQDSPETARAMYKQYMERT